MTYCDEDQLPSITQLDRGCVLSPSASMSSAPAISPEFPTQRTFFHILFSACCLLHSSYLNLQLSRLLVNLGGFCLFSSGPQYSPEPRTVLWHRAGAQGTLTEAMDLFMQVQGANTFQQDCLPSCKVLAPKGPSLFPCVCVHMCVCMYIRVANLCLSH